MELDLTAEYWWAHSGFHSLIMCAKFEFNALQLVGHKLPRFRVSICERLFTYEIIKELQKVFTGRNVEPQ